MFHITYYCRECAGFVGGPLATCTKCGHTHERDRKALESPPRLRRRRRR